MPRQTEEAHPKLQISLVQVIAAALASITSAVILSRFGVAGTYVGTAVGSVISTVSVAVYSHTMRQARRRVRTYSQHHHAGRVIEEAPAVRTPPAAWNRSHPRSLRPVTVRASRPPRRGWRARWDRLEQWFAALPLWGKAGVTGGTAFVVAVAAVVLFQILSGQSLTNLVRGQATGGSGPNPACAIGCAPTATSAPVQSPGPTPAATSQPTQQPTVPPTPAATPFSTPAATPVPSLAPSAIPTPSP